MHPTTTYAIIENGQPMDGEFYTRAELMLAIQYADYDATIIALDLGEISSSGNTPARDVTEDMTVEWWHANGLHDTYDMIAAGKESPGLAYRYFSDECAVYEMRVAS